MNSCNKIQPANITATLAAGSVASPYYFEVNITQRLCYACCVENAPVFAPKFSLIGVSQVGTNQFVATIHVEGIIAYTACGGGCDCCKQQPLSQAFTVPFSFTGSNPVVTLEQGAPVNTMAATGCQPCSRTFVSETPITLAVAAAAA